MPLPANETLEGDDGSDSDPNKLSQPMTFTDGTALDPLIAAFQAEATAQGATAATISKIMPIAKGLLQLGAGVAGGPAASALAGQFLALIPNQI